MHVAQSAHSVVKSWLFVDSSSWSPAVNDPDGANFCDKHTWKPFPVVAFGDLGEPCFEHPCRQFSKFPSKHVYEVALSCFACIEAFWVEMDQVLEALGNRWLLRAHFKVRNVDLK